MKHLQVHLWREWREHRVALYLIAGCLALGAAVLTQVAPSAFLPVEWAIPCVIAVVVLSVGSDLFSTEKVRGTDAFLARTPGALVHAYRAKAVFFLLLYVGAGIYGALLCTATSLVAKGEWPRGFSQFHTTWNLLYLALGFLWVFSISSWVKSSVLTAPLTMLFLAIVALPCWVLTKGLKWFTMSDTDMLVFILIAACGAMLSARVGFVRGGERHWSGRKATLASMVVALLFFAPQWAWAGHHYLAMKHAEFIISP